MRRLQERLPAGVLAALVLAAFCLWQIVWPIQDAHAATAAETLNAAGNNGPAVAAEKEAVKGKSRFLKRWLLPAVAVAAAGAYFLFFRGKNASAWPTNVRLDGSDRLAEGVVGMWSFNGDCRDLSTYGNHGRPEGEPAFTAGVFGSACSFDGTADRVLVTEKGAAGGPVPVVLRNLRQGTISLWFRIADYPPQIYPLIHFGSSSDADESSLIVEIGHNLGGGKLYFTVVSRLGKVLQCFDSGRELSAGTWHHFVATVDEGGDDDDRGANTGYLDGAEMSDRHYNVGTSSTYAFFFDDVETQELFAVGYGRFAMPDCFYHARATIDELIVWNRVLSAADVAELFQRAGSK